MRSSRGELKMVLAVPSHDHRVELGLVPSVDFAFCKYMSRKDAVLTASGRAHDQEGSTSLLIPCAFLQPSFW